MRRQQQQQWGHHQHYQQWSEPDPETVLPSETTTLTSSNFQQHVWTTHKPWLIMVTHQLVNLCINHQILL